MFAVAATSVLSLCGSSAMADTQADGNAMNTPGALSGSTVQAPDHTPENDCAVTADATTALSSVIGGTCADGPKEASDGHDPEHGDRAPERSLPGHGDETPAALTQGRAEASTGGTSSTVQVTDEEPAGDCGDLAAVFGVLNPLFGDVCGDGYGGDRDEDGYGEDGYGEDGYGGGYGDETPPAAETPKQTPPPVDDKVTPPAEEKTPTPDEEPPADGEDPPSLPQTGAGALLSAAAASAGLLAGGTALYRRGRRGMSHR